MCEIKLLWNKRGISKEGEREAVWQEVKHPADISEKNLWWVVIMYGSSANIAFPPNGKWICPPIFWAHNEFMKRKNNILSYDNIVLSAGEVIFYYDFYKLYSYRLKLKLAMPTSE